MFKKAKDNGSKLMIKARKADALPQEWKAYTWDCDNAILPTVLVDDNVLWYGFPQAIGTFMDGKNGFSTVNASSQYTAVCRIQVFTSNVPKIIGRRLKNSNNEVTRCLLKLYETILASSSENAESHR